MRKIALFGYSGHSYVIADAIKLSGDQIIGYYDKEKAPSNPYHLSYLGNERNAGVLQLLKEQQAYGMVSLGENSIRRKIMEFLSTQGVAHARVIHPSAIISAMANIGEGSFVSAGVKVNALASVRAGVILNTACVVEHECEIGSFVHIAPAAVLAGGVRVGEGSFIGANAVIKPGISIGKNVVIGAGSVVLKDVPDHQTWVGNPARALSR